MLDKTYACIDIGETNIKLVTMSSCNEDLHISGTYLTKSKGISEGVIYSKSEFQTCINDLLIQANKDNKVEISDVVVVIPSSLVRIYRQKQTIEVRNNNVCEERDLQELEDKFKKELITDKESEVLFKILPLQFTRDGYSDGLTNPVGFKCSKIGINALAITVPRQLKTTFQTSLKDLGLNVVDLMIAPYASAAAILTKDDNVQASIIIDIGGNYTTLSLHSDYKVYENLSVNLGCKRIIEKIANEFSLDDEEAREVFERYACAFQSESKDITVYKSKDGKELKEALINKIVENGFNEILSKLQEKTGDAIESLKLGRIYLTGGGANIREIDHKVQSFLMKDCFVRKYKKVGGRDTMFTTAIGGILAYVSKKQGRQLMEVK